MTLPEPRKFLRALLDAAVAAVQPAECLPPHLPPPPRGRTIVLGAGKAAGAMVAAVEANWKGPLFGLVITRDGYVPPGRVSGPIELVEASHPIPDARGAAAAARILGIVKTATADDLVLCLLPGGASALMAAPAPGIDLAEKRKITSQLLKSGASIVEMNCVRKHLSAIKGGRLAAAAGAAQVVSLIISDVVGDDMSVIASGPTVVDPTTCADALAVLDRYEVNVAEAVSAGLRRGSFETPKHLAGNVTNRIVARPIQALGAAAKLARDHGLEVLVLGDRCEGIAREAAHDHVALVRRIVAGNGPVRAPCLILSGGEVVVKVTGEGRGGPNSEFALGLAEALEGAPNAWALAADTDGIDGNSEAAGALVTPDSLTRAKRLGLDPARSFADSDAAGLFDAIGDLLRPGPSFTNVNDFRAILVLPG